MDTLIQIPNLYWKIFALSTCLKILLIPSYKSTDFEVHRNWLSITYSLHFREWYQNEHSIWTLDYPPFFAWLEYILANIANYVDPNMLKIENLNYESRPTILYHRLTVIILDLIYALGIKRCLDKIQDLLSSLKENTISGNVISIKTVIHLILPVFLLMNFGLLIVDHIHFQYNGILFGLLFLSFSYIIEDRNYVGALLFAMVLNFKHIFLYSALGYGFYYIQWLAELYTSYQSRVKQNSRKKDSQESNESLLPSLSTRKHSSISIPSNGTLSNREKSICGCEESNHFELCDDKIALPYSFDEQSKRSMTRSEVYQKLALKIISLAALMMGIFIISFGPFIYYDQFSQVLRRMFPFGRGLRHDFWAPNVWALYGTLDKILASFFGKGTVLATESPQPFADYLDANSTLESNDSMIPQIISKMEVHGFLPEMRPSTVLAITLISCIPFIVRLKHSYRSLQMTEPSRLARPLLDRLTILEYVIWASYSSFLFGWHVHEKACLLITLPFTLYLGARVVSHLQAHHNTTSSPKRVFTTYGSNDSTTSTCKEKITLAALGRAWLIFSLSADLALTTLLHERPEYLTKTCLYILYHVCTFVFVAKYTPNDTISETGDDVCCFLKLFSFFVSPSSPGKFVKLYGLGLGLLYFTAFGSPYIPGLGLLFNQIYGKYPFLPLMSISAYCAVGTIYSWYLFASTLIAESATRSYLTGAQGHDSTKIE